MNETIPGLYYKKVYQLTNYNNMYNLKNPNQGAIKQF